jgi:hypothetical protein
VTGPSLLQRIAQFARRRYRLLFLVFAALTLLSAALVTRLSFETDMLKLLPQQDPAIRAYVETLRDFGTFSYLLVVIRIPEGAVVDPYEALADDVAAALRGVPELARVEHRLGDPEELLATFFPKAMLFLSPAERQAVAGKLTDEGIARRASELARLIKTPQGLAAKQLVRLDPLGLAEVFFDRLQGSRGSLKVDWTSGYYLSQDHRLLLILAQPKRPPQDVEFVQSLVAGVDAVVARELAHWPQIAGPDAPPAPQVGLGGPYLTSLGDASLIRRDMTINVFSSAAGVFLLFLFAFRRKGALLYAFVPLLAAILVTFGLLAATVGALSSATSVVGALLIGLGIDFVIVSYGRYIEERRRGVGLEGALAAMSGFTGRAVVVGAVTTAATFYAFSFTDFTGLRQMGLMTGTGILICMASVLLLLPAMLAWTHDRHARRRTEPKLYLHSLGTNHLMRFSMRHPRPVLAAGGLVTVAALLLSTRLTFDESMKTMRPRGNRGMEVAEEVARHFGSGFDSMLLVLTGRSLPEVLELSERAVAGARELIEAGVLQGVSGVPSLIPAPQRQQEALAWLARERRRALDMAHPRDLHPRGGPAGPARRGVRAGARAAGGGGGAGASGGGRRLPGQRADGAPPRPLPAPHAARLEERGLPLSAGPPVAARAAAAGGRAGAQARAARRALGRQRHQPAGAPAGAARRLDRRHPRAHPGGAHPLAQLQEPAARAARADAGHGGDRLDARGDGAGAHPDELHEHLRHHHDHRHRRRLRRLRAAPLPRDGGGERAGRGARAGRDRQRRGHGLALDHHRLRLDHLLELPRPAGHRRGGDPGRLLRLLRHHHPPPRLARLAPRRGRAAAGQRAGAGARGRAAAGVGGFQSTEPTRRTARTPRIEPEPTGRPAGPT